MKSLAEDILEDISLDGERAGIKKVVDWIEKHALKKKALTGDNRVILALEYEELKEWLK